MSHGHTESHGHLGHIVEPALFQKVLGTLVVLTIITVAVSRVELGVLNIAVAETSSATATRLQLCTVTRADCGLRPGKVEAPRPTAPVPPSSTPH